MIGVELLFYSSFWSVPQLSCFPSADQSEGQGHVWEAGLSDLQRGELCQDERVHPLPQDGALHPLPGWVLICLLSPSLSKRALLHLPVVYMNRKNDLFNIWLTEGSWFVWLLPSCLPLLVDSVNTWYGVGTNFMFYKEVSSAHQGCIYLIKTL